MAATAIRPTIHAPVRLRLDSVRTSVVDRVAGS
jgi:hypothetical protein